MWDLNNNLFIPSVELCLESLKGKDGVKKSREKLWDNFTLIRQLFAKLNDSKIAHNSIGVIFVTLQYA
jgi:hypothetical protein